jgi:hypothetical protein
MSKQRFEPHELFALWYADYPSGQPVLDGVFVNEADAEAEKAERTRASLTVTPLDDYLDELLDYSVPCRFLP